VTLEVVIKKVKSFSTGRSVRWRRAAWMKCRRALPRKRLSNKSYAPTVYHLFAALLHFLTSLLSFSVAWKKKQRSSRFILSRQHTGLVTCHRQNVALQNQLSRPERHLNAQPSLPRCQRLSVTSTVKRYPFWEMLYLFWVWDLNGGSTYFGYFSKLTCVQPHHFKGLGESFPLM